MNPTDLERRLAAWRPISPDLDRDRMLYQAGRAGARAEARRSALIGAALVGTVVLGLGLNLVRERSARIALEGLIAATTERRDEPVATSSIVEQRRVGPESHLVLLRRALDGDRGPRPVAAGPTSTGLARPPLTARDRRLPVDL